MSSRKRARGAGSSSVQKLVAFVGQDDSDSSIGTGARAAVSSMVERAEANTIGRDRMGRSRYVCVHAK